MSITDIHKNVEKDEMSSEDAFALRAILDPIVWAENTLRNPEDPTVPLSLRKYQKEVINWQPRETTNEEGRAVIINRIKCYRMGRRVGKTIVLAVETLWKACTNHNFKILYIAPFESQCQLFFGIIDKLLTNTYIIPKRFVRKPYICEFKNGSIITAHTANVRSSRKGSSIRGAEGDMIVIDEMDHGIDEVVNEVVMPIYMGNNRSTIIGASTPSGMRGLFYLWNQRDSEVNLGIKAFHYPSQVSPRWTPEAEKLARAQMTRSQYIHEILAEFGEAMEGVFKNKDLDYAMKKYQYKDLRFDRKENYYIMGVDWNEKFGTCIVILQMHKRTKKIKVFRNVIIPKQEFTQLQGIDKIIELHKEYFCDFLYVDKGYGSTNIELLKKYGIENKSSLLDKITKDIDYGGNIEVRDPISGKKVKKPAKPFLVNNSVRVVEAKNIEVPEDEDTEFGLVGQMRNFRVVKLSASGHPIYEGKLRGEDNDHSLNALMLAVLGFEMEYGELNDYKTSTKVANISKRSMYAPLGYQREEVANPNIAAFKNLLNKVAPGYIDNDTGTVRKDLKTGRKKTTAFISTEERAKKENILRKRLRKRVGFGRPNI